MINSANTKPAPRGWVLFSFLAVYLVWGSTYFFIRKALGGFPPFLLGGIRFLTAGLIMLIWSLIRKEKLMEWTAIKPAAISSFLTLFIGNGMVIWVEQYVTSAWVAIIIAAAPIWFVVLDKSHWSENLKSKTTVAGLITGFIGILLLFTENISASVKSRSNPFQTTALILLIFSTISWVVGSLYSKYRKPQPAATVNTTWQLLFSGIYFFIGAGITREYDHFHFSQVSEDAWFSLGYLIVFGSIIAYSAYVWLMQVRSPAQVSTYAYVNPVVAVILGVFIAAERITLIQIAGLVVILISVLMINLPKYRKLFTKDPE